MTRKERLIEIARDTYGIKNAADMTERQLRKEVAGLKAQDPNYQPPTPKAKAKPRKVKKPVAVKQGVSASYRVAVTNTPPAELPVPKKKGILHKIKRMIGR